jgi:hypothetical protein
MSTDNAGGNDRNHDRIDASALGWWAAARSRSTIASDRLTTPAET